MRTTQRKRGRLDQSHGFELNVGAFFLSISLGILQGSATGPSVLVIDPSAPPNDSPVSGRDGPANGLEYGYVVDGRGEAPKGVDGPAPNTNFSGSGAEAQSDPSFPAKDSVGPRPCLGDP